MTFIYITIPHVFSYYSYYLLVTLSLSLSIYLSIYLSLTAHTYIHIYIDLYNKMDNKREGKDKYFDIAANLSDDRFCKGVYYEKAVHESDIRQVI